MEVCLKDAINQQFQVGMKNKNLNKYIIKNEKFNRIHNAK